MLDAKVRCSKNKQLLQAVPEHLTLDILFLNVHTRNFCPFCCEPLHFTAGFEGFRVQVFSNDLRVAQLVERETVRVALYLEVACSTQALEIPFAECLISFGYFPIAYRPIRILLFAVNGVDPAWNQACGVTFQHVW